MRRFAAVVVLLMATGLLAACNALQDGDDDVPPAPGADDWKDLGLPYGVAVGEWPMDYHLGFGEASVIVETEVPGEPGDPGYDDRPYPALVSMAATADAGLFTFEVRNGTSEVWMLTADGDWSRVGRQVLGIPITDVAGHHAFWTAREDDPRVVAYSTEEERVVETLPSDDDDVVYAVDDATAYISGYGNQILWTVGQEPEDIERWFWDFRTGIGDVGLEQQDDYDTIGVIRDGDGTVLLRDTRLDGGILDPEGTALVTTVRGGLEFDVRTFPDLQPVDLTPDRLFESRPSVRNISWAADGRLVIEGGQPARTLVCAVPDGACQEIANRDEGYIGRWGQVLRTDQPEGP